MSIGAAALRGLYKLAGVKKMFAMPEEKLLKEIEKQNKHRGFFMPTDHKAFYRKREINGFPCLIVQERPRPAKRAILFFFGGGMVIGPDAGSESLRPGMIHCYCMLPCYKEAKEDFAKVVEFLKP